MIASARQTSLLSRIFLPCGLFLAFGLLVPFLFLAHFFIPVMPAPGEMPTLIAGASLALTASAAVFFRRILRLSRTLARTTQDLLESETRFRDFAESASDWFWETDADLVFTDVSGRLREVTGNRPERVIGQSLAEVCRQRCRDRGARDCRDCVSGQKVFRDLSFEIDLDGDLRTYRLNGRPVFDAGGAFTGYRGSGVDITAEVAAERRARKLRDLLVDAVDSIAEGFILFDDNGRLVVCNEQYKRAYPLLADLLEPGVTFESVLRAAAERTGLTANPDIDLQHWIGERLKRHLESPAPADVKLADGEWYRIGEHSTRSGGIVKVLMNITEIKRHENDLARQSAMLQGVFDAVSQGVGVFDADDTLIAWNDTFVAVMGYPEHFPDISTSLVDLVRFDRARGVTAIQLPHPRPVRTIRRRHMRLSDMHVRLPDGRVVEILFETMPDAGFLATCTDISDRLKNEHALLQAQKMDAVGQLAGGIAHEFNNMLTAIGGFARMAQRTPDDSERTQSCLNEVVKASDRAADLTSQLLNFSRRGAEARLVPVALKILFKELQSFLHPVLGETVSLQIDFEAADVQVLGDPNRLHQAFVNLIINARDAMPAGGVVSIGVVPLPKDDAELLERNHGDTSPGILVRISDTGTGIPKEIRDRVFEPFFTTKEQGKGTGLGLPMVYSTVDAMGGVLRIEDNPDGGTTFAMRLPLHVPADHGALDVTPAEQAESPLPSPILLVEDETPVQRFLTMVLSDQGIEVIGVANGREGLDAFRAGEHVFQAVISDMTMPEMGGLEMARHLRAENADLPIVFLTGYGGPNLVIDADETLSTCTVLEKPVAPDELIRALRDAIMTTS